MTYLSITNPDVSVGQYLRFGYGGMDHTVPVDGIHGYQTGDIVRVIEVATGGDTGTVVAIEPVKTRGVTTDGATRPDWSTSWFQVVDRDDMEPLETPPSRPRIDFSLPRYSTARRYAGELKHPKLSGVDNDLLTQVSLGYMVDAYTLAEAVLAAARSAANRGRNAKDRNTLATKAGHLGHIAHSVIQNHADNLPAYAEGDRSRAVEDAKVALREAATEIDALTEQHETMKANLTAAREEAVELLRAERRQNARLRAKLRDVEREEEIARVVMGQVATEFLTHAQREYVRGFSTGLRLT